MFQFYTDVPHFQCVAHLLIIISFLFYFLGKLSSIFSIQTIFPFKIIVVGIQQKAFSSQIHSSFVVHQHLQLKILLDCPQQIPFSLLPFRRGVGGEVLFLFHIPFPPLPFRRGVGGEVLFLFQFPFPPLPFKKVVVGEVLFLLQIPFPPLPFRRGVGGEVPFLLQLYFLRINNISQ